MLKIDKLSVDYGGLRALSGVSFDVNEGDFVAVIGANGAGKSTLFKALSGTVKATSGTITFDGINLLAVAPHERAHLGIAHVPEGRKVFASLSVLENLELGAHARLGRACFAQSLSFIYEMFPVLAERRAQLAGTLSGGQQQMLAIGRGLAAAPRLLLLDEPSLGLAPVIADEIFERISQVHRERGLTILLVEQRVGEALEACDKGVLLESGHVIKAGRRDELLEGAEALRSSYLGV